MALEQLLVDLTAALTANTEVLGKILAGRDEALAKLEAGAAAAEGGPKTTRTRRTTKADEAPAAVPADTGNVDGAPAVTESPEAGAAAASEPAPTPVVQEAPAISDDMIRSEATAYVAGGGTQEESQKRGAFIASLLQHFGTKSLVGETGITDPADRKQCLFFVRRKVAGLDVDFAADYDFDGDPAQELVAAAASGGDFAGIG